MNKLFNLRIAKLQADPNLLRLVLLIVSLSLSLLIGGAPEGGGGFTG